MRSSGSLVPFRLRLRLHCICTLFFNRFLWARAQRSRNRFKCKIESNLLSSTCRATAMPSVVGHWATSDERANVMHSCLCCKSIPMLLSDAHQPAPLFTRYATIPNFGVYLHQFPCRPIFIRYCPIPNRIKCIDALFWRRTHTHTIARHGDNRLQFEMHRTKS